MDIKWDNLPHGPSNFRDGLEFVEDLRTWSDDYESRAMVPNEWSHKLAELMIRILLYNMPNFLKPMGKQVVIALMDERLRRAMKYDDPPSYCSKLVAIALNMRKFVLRSLMSPRPYSMRYRSIADDPDHKTGKYYQLIYEGEPW